MSLSKSLLYLLPILLCLPSHLTATPTSRCRNQPGDPGFPSSTEWASFNETIGGRLVVVVPSAKFCHSLPSGNCTEDQWQSTVFRSQIPGAMDVYNWEQDYTSNPPSLCLQDGTTCGQGNVPVFAVNATDGSHIQAGVKFAVKHNLKVAVKASGHDFLGRSTARGSLLLWTHYLRNISFTESFIINGTNLGSAVTVGSGVPLNVLYNATKKEGKVYVGGDSADVILAGGYIQGAGHSALSPVFGLASDNALEFTIVIANGSIVTANSVENSELFWALRGGGAGSWGVVLSATVRTYPTFNATVHNIEVLATTNASTITLMSIHARHIFDWDSVRAGQYFGLFPGQAFGIDGNMLALTTWFVNMSATEAKAAMKPFLDEVTSKGFSLQDEEIDEGLVNDLLEVADTDFGSNGVMGSRLIPAEAYKNNPDAIGEGYAALIQNGVTDRILGHRLAGGKVAENANIDSAVTPKWRTAKTHLLVAQEWPDSLTIEQIETIKHNMTDIWVPILASMTGESDSGSYSNEADVREPNFQQTFFGPNYPRLRSIKKLYDPNSLFIVGAGVGSEEWDSDGICRL